ncbi:hypothetical protein pb186bvf_006331 [Paramecium bursaria]
MNSAQDRVIKQLRDEILELKQALSRMSLQKDELVYEMNKMQRGVQRYEINLKEKEQEIQSLQGRLINQEQSFNEQMQQLKESAITRVKCEAIRPDQQIIEQKQIPIKYVEQEEHIKHIESSSRDVTRSQSINEFHKLNQEKQDLAQVIENLQKKLQLSQQFQDDMSEEIQNLRSQLETLYQENLNLKEDINKLQEQVSEAESNLQNETIKYHIQIEDLETQLQFLKRQ